MANIKRGARIFCAKTGRTGIVQKKTKRGWQIDFNGRSHSLTELTLKKEFKVVER